MDLWDTLEELDMDIEETPNKYLNDKNEALNLISKILTFSKENNNLKKKVFKLDKLIEDDLFNITSKMNMTNQEEVYNRLKVIKNKLQELKMIQLLNKKYIIGIGGMFSAGKSKFINSIMGYDILPENQLPTTSIPTYIIKGEEKLSAYTFDNLEIKLDYEEINAISHIFYDEYNISFTSFIKSIVIQNNNNKYENIVFLDTPGYTKSDNFKKDDNTDLIRAKECLSVCDYIIWLMDIENGVIVQRDIEFINNLNITKPILFVFNKADKKCKEDIESIIKNTNDILLNTGLNVYGVTAYSSMENKEYINNYIEKFVNEISLKSNESKDLLQEVDNILDEYDFYFKKTKEKFTLERKCIYENIVNKANDLKQIISLAKLYSSINKELMINNAIYRKFKALKPKIVLEIESIVL